jgi:hypothetical protein
MTTAFDGGRRNQVPSATAMRETICDVRRGLTLPLFGAAVAFALMAEPLSAQTVIPGPDETISVHAQSVRLVDVLRAVAAVHPFEKLIIEAAVENRLVTVAIDAVDTKRALVAILEAAEVDFAMAGPKRLIAGKSVGVADLPSTPAPAAPESTQEAVAQNVVIDPAAEQIRMQRQNVELEQAFARPAALPPPGSVLLLPFPAADGSPVTAIKPVLGVPAAGRR